MNWPWQRTRRWLHELDAARVRARATAALPVLAVRDGVVFPDDATELTVGRPASIAALRAAEAHPHLVWVVAQPDAKHDEPTPAQLRTVGCVTRVDRVEWLGEIAVARVHGLVRARGAVTHEGRAMVEPIDEVACANDELDAKGLLVLRHVAREVVASRGMLPAARARALVASAASGRLADLILPVLGLAVSQAQHMLETPLDAVRIAFVRDVSQHQYADAMIIEEAGRREAVIQRLRGR